MIPQIIEPPAEGPLGSVSFESRIDSRSIVTVQLLYY